MPPTRTPIAAPAPPTAPQAACAFARASPWKPAVMIESAAGERRAAPTPWPARAANRVVALVAIADMKEELVKMTSPARTGGGVLEGRRRGHRTARGCR